ncbi:MAG TPA: hypothetical protein VEU31_09635, partial [Candidatus Acidoferrales bacterium]|nr:hypothetical protein [Candidatus Acidoferrales bacterium]
LVLQGDAVVLSPQEFAEYVSKQSDGTAVHLVSFTPEALAPAWQNSAARSPAIESISVVLAPVIGQLGHSRAARNQLLDAYTLDANYVRRSDAELFWKGPASKAKRA